MRVLSLFDGIAGARQALKNLNISCQYYACEIDRFAIKVALSNHDDIKYFSYFRESGFDVKDLLSDEWEKLPLDIQEIGGYLKQKKVLLEEPINLLIGGSPCQDLSIAKKNRKGLDGEKSSLFYEYVRILKKCKPQFFILENVASMSKESKELINKELFGIEPILINSSLLTAQQRKRLYWIGKLRGDGNYSKVDIEQPQDKGILLKDILENGVAVNNKSNCLTATYYKCSGLRDYVRGGRPVVAEPIRLGHFNKGSQGDRIYSVQGKSINLSANGGGKGAKTGLYKINLPNGDYAIRKLTTIECERLQGFPDNYTISVSNTQAYKCLGNSFTVPVIEHILRSILKI